MLLSLIYFCYCAYIKKTRYYLLTLFLKHFSKFVFFFKNMPWCLSYYSIFLKEIRNNGEKLNKCPTCAVLFSVYFQCGAKKPMKWFVKNKNQIFITILSRLIWMKYYHTTQLLIFLCKYCEAYTIIVVYKICNLKSGTSNWILSIHFFVKTEFHEKN